MADIGLFSTNGIFTGDPGAFLRRGPASTEVPASFDCSGPGPRSQMMGLKHLESIAIQQSAAAETTAVPTRIPGGSNGDRGWRERRNRYRRRRIIVLIPAHNEAGSIAQTITSLRAQTVPVAAITVVCDNCTDDTAAIASSLGANVMTTVGNRARKAGALNQALARLLPTLNDDDYLLAMDADSSLSPAWLATASNALARDRRVGAVCGVFLGEPGCGIVGQIQRNEYYRYARIIKRRWQALVLSGTGTLFKVPVLRAIVRERGSRLPGVYGNYYNEASITEDDEITLAVKTLGWRCLCPAACETTTEVMPTWKALWTQRMRWQMGTLGDLKAYGISPVTRSYWARQAGLYGGFFASFVCLLIMLAAVFIHPGSAWPGPPGYSR